MKRFLISLGKAVLYTLLFLGVQAAAVWIIAFFGSLYALLAPYGGNPFFSDITSLATIVSCVLLYVLLFLFFAVRRKWLHHETGFCVMPAAGQVLTGTFSLGFGLCILLNFMLALLPFPAEWIERYEEQASWLAEDSAVSLFFATVLFAPLAEELVFRGLVYVGLATDGSGVSGAGGYEGNILSTMEPEDEGSYDLNYMPGLDDVKDMFSSGLKEYGKTQGNMLTSAK
ncbi:MAG: hypothetical protein ACI3XM_06060, partial [Eubacteriales bacterium]